MNVADFEYSLKSIINSQPSSSVTETRRTKLPLNRSMGASPPIPCRLAGGGGCGSLKMEPFSSSLRRPRSASISDDSDCCHATCKRQRIDSRLGTAASGSIYALDDLQLFLATKAQLEAVHEGGIEKDPKNNLFPYQHQVFKPLMQPATALATTRAAPLHHQSNSPVKDGAPSSTLPSQQTRQQINPFVTATTLPAPSSLATVGSDYYNPTLISNGPDELMRANEARATADPGFDCWDEEDLMANVNSWLLEEQELSLQEMLVGLFD